MGSFDFAGASLREAPAALKMTVWQMLLLLRSRLQRVECDAGFLLLFLELLGQVAGLLRFGFHAFGLVDGGEGVFVFGTVSVLFLL
jgi:hypothetical protein